ncbi:MAG: hypothetical protein JRG97_08550 [Deltaproteobacteria bacterium]|nr:hypothetical protein [Deltaproteobacteria bacterium]
MNKKVYAKYTRIFDYPKVTIAQVHSRCTDAGCYLQLSCDISVAADDALFGHPAQKWGGSQSTPLWQRTMRFLATRRKNGAALSQHPFGSFTWGLKKLDIF